MDWSWLGKINWGDVASGVGQVAAAAAARRAQGRAQETQLATSRDLAALHGYGTEQEAALQAAGLAQQGLLQGANLDLLRRRFALDAPVERARQAGLGDLLANVQDVQATHPRAHIVQFSGGLRPSVLGPSGRAAGGLLSDQAVGALRSGQDVNFAPLALPDMRSALLRAPSLTPVPQAGAGDSFLNWATAAGGATSALWPAIQAALLRYQQPQGRLQGRAGIQDPFLD